MQPPRERVGVYYGWVVLIVARSDGRDAPGRTLGSA